MTAAPQRNFDLPTDERIRALVSGAPAFARRLRAIEDLEEAIVRAFGREGDGERTRSLAFRARAHQKLRELVILHNRYYPIEANLPTCLRTGEFLDRDGTPWRPRPCPSMDDLRACAAGRRDGEYPRRD